MEILETVLIALQTLCSVLVIAVIILFFKGYMERRIERNM
jgi:hypothetical protein